MPRSNLGLVQLRKDPAAIATFTELIQRKPDLADVYDARGEAHLFAKQYPEALTDLEEAVWRKRDDGIAWMLVGSCASSSRSRMRSKRSAGPPRSVYRASRSVAEETAGC